MHILNAQAHCLSQTFTRTIVCYSSGSREEMRDILALASAGKIKTIYEEFRLTEVNDVLKRLKKGELLGRGVLTP